MKENLIRHVKTLSETIGPRSVENIDKLYEAENYVAGELRSYGYTPEFQEYNVFSRGTDYPCRNVIAVKEGTRPELPIIILGGHYDSDPTTPGADDNASAVAGVLEVARALASVPLERTVKFIGFVNEEPPFFGYDDMGSKQYAVEARNKGEDILLAIIFEMIGYYSEQPNSQYIPSDFEVEEKYFLTEWFGTVGNFLSVIGNSPSLSILAQVEKIYKSYSNLCCKTNAPPETPLLPFPEPCETASELEILKPDKNPMSCLGLDSLCWSDNMSFWDEGYRSIMVTDTAYLRNKNYHQETDTWDTLNYDLMAEVVKGFIGVIKEL